MGGTLVTKFPSPIDRHVGGRIRMRRMLAGISQEKLGEALGITFQQVQKYEKGSNRVSASRLQIIARVLDVPIAFFFDGAPGGEQTVSNVDVAASEYITDFAATSEGVQLMRAFSQIKDVRARRRLIDLIEAIAEQEAERG